MEETHTYVLDLKDGGGKKLEKETKKILKKFSGRPFIFNLAHGIMPKTPVKNVYKLVNIIREYKNEI